MRLAYAGCVRVGKTEVSTVTCVTIVRTLTLSIIKMIATIVERNSKMSKWVVESSYVYEVATDDIRKSLEMMEFPSFPSVDNDVHTAELVEFLSNGNTVTELDSNLYRVYSEFSFIVDTDNIEDAINEMEFCDYRYGDAEFIQGDTDYYEMKQESVA